MVARAMPMIEMSEYRSRRKQFLKKMPKNSMAVLWSATLKKRSNDTEYPFRQESNFYYLSGFNEDNAVLVFFRGRKRKESKCLLFVQQKDPKLELWTGKRVGVKEAAKLYGFDAVYAVDELEKRVEEYANKVTTLLYLFQEKNENLTRLEAKLPQIRRCKDAGVIVANMRLIKSPAEIALIRKAIKITQDAHHRAIQKAHKCSFEYELQAEIEYVFTKEGAYSDAYTSIVASGDNANTLHYIKNDDIIGDEDLILIDAGCEYQYYASDITRTIPARGKFTEAQKELYTLVLNVEKEIISMVREGVLRSELQKKAQKMLCKGMLELGILKGKFKKVYKKEKYKKYFPHGIGHFMGLDVHDQNPYKDAKGKEIPLQAGMVLTIEPGIYLPSEDTKIPKKYRGIGIRIEDDILVTKNGCENLSEGIVKEIQEIESFTSR